MKTQLSKPARDRARYNRTRLHSSLDYQSPITFESKLTQITLNQLSVQPGQAQFDPDLPPGYSETLSGEPLRVSWVSITTLLRAVGHVLCKVDAARARGAFAPDVASWFQHGSIPAPFALEATRASRF